MMFYGSLYFNYLDEIMHQINFNFGLNKFVILETLFNNLKDNYIFFKRFIYFDNYFNFLLLVLLQVNSSKLVYLEI